MNINISDKRDNNFDDLKQSNEKDKNREQREHWSYKSEENREENEKFKKSNTDNVVNKDSATSDLVDSAFKIDFNKNSPARLNNKGNFDFSKRNNVTRKAKFTVTDQSKSDNTIKIANYPADTVADHI